MMVPFKEGDALTTFLLILTDYEGPQLTGMPIRF